MARMLRASMEVLEVTQGLWCYTCLLATGVMIVWASVTSGEFSEVTLQTTYRCRECHGSHIEPPDVTV